jgi:uncharacterized membrane protein YuzA (DUF378 family)
MRYAIALVVLVVALVVGTIGVYAYQLVSHVSQVQAQSLSTLDK